MKGILCVLLSLIGLSLFLSCTEEIPQYTGDYDNPIALQRPDPWVYKHTDGNYYFTSSYNYYSSGTLMFDRINLRRASTINGLKTAREYTIFKAPDVAAGMYSYIWAPELHYIDGVWYIYVTASTSSSAPFTVRQWVMKCTDADPITGTWTIVGTLAPTTINNFAVDGTVFELNDQLYYVWSQKRAISSVDYACLYIAKMTSPTLVDETVVTEISIPEYDWEKKTYNVNEAPAILMRNGKVFIVYSASGCDKNYCLGLLTADQTSDLLVASSWTKSATTVFHSSDDNVLYGPGHCSFTTDGDSDVIMYHARSYPEIWGTNMTTVITDGLYDINRAARAQKFTWNADGTPYFGEPR